jgi:hypothetical protein
MMNDKLNDLHQKMKNNQSKKNTFDKNTFDRTAVTSKMNLYKTMDDPSNIFVCQQLRLVSIKIERLTDRGASKEMCPMDPELQRNDIHRHSLKYLNILPVILYLELYDFN